MGKYLELFRGEVGDLTEKTKLENKPYVAYSTKLGKVVFTEVVKLQPNNEIWYTTSNGEINPFNDNYCNAKLISNTYKDGKGVAKFDSDITKIWASYDFGETQGYLNSFIGYKINENGNYDGEAWHLNMLSKISLPDSLVEIGEFSLCYDQSYAGNISLSCPIDELEIGKGVQIFKGQTNSYVNTIIYRGTIKDWTSINFETLYYKGSTYYPLHATGTLIINGGEIKDDLVIPNDVVDINKYSFRNCMSLTSIDLGNVQTIGESAFESCTSLTSIDLANVQTIGSYAFNGCKLVNSITIPDSVTNIGFGTFTGLKLLSSNFINNSSLDAEANNYWGATVYDEITEDGLIITGTTVVGYAGGSGAVDDPKYINIPTYVTKIERSAISYVENIYLTYDGTEENWNNIVKPGYDDDWCYRSTSPNSDGVLIIKLKDKDIEVWTYSA